MRNLEWGKDIGLMTWDEAMAYTESLSDDWRLPTIAELIDTYASKPMDFVSGNYRSSTACALSSTNVWNVYLGVGYVSFNVKTDVIYVRCVRSFELDTSCKKLTPQESNNEKV